MSTFVRIRRLHRTPLRLGTVSVSNSSDGSLIDLDDFKVRRDMKNSYDRWVFVDRTAGARPSSYPTVQVVTLTGNTGTTSFKLTYEGTETAAFVRGTNQAASDLQTAVRTLTGDTALTVAGTTNEGPYTITFVNVDSPGLLSVTSPSVASLSGAVTSNLSATVNKVANMSPLDAGTALSGTLIFGGATGSSEFAWVMDLPAGYPVKNVTLYVSTAAGASSTHGWLSVATYDGTSALTYQAVTADATSGTIIAGAKVFQPVVSAGVPYVTPYEGQYIFTMTQATGSSTTAVFAGAASISHYVTDRLAGAIPQNVNSYGNSVTSNLVNPWGSATGQAVTTPPVIATPTTSIMTNYTPSIYMPYCEVSSS